MDKKEKEIGKKIVRGFLKFLIKIINMVYRVKVNGIEKLPKKGPYIIVSNHRSKLDPPLLLNLLNENIVFLAKKELANTGPGRLIIWAFDIILIDRKNIETSSIKTLMNALKKGKIVGIFPEGTREGFNKTGKIKTGAIFIALRQKVDIIPIGINGSFKMFGNDNHVNIGDKILKVVK